MRPLGAFFDRARPLTHLMLAHGEFAAPKIEALHYAAEKGLLEEVAIGAPAQGSVVVAPKGGAAAVEHQVVGFGDLGGDQDAHEAGAKRSKGEENLTVAQRLEVCAWLRSF